MAVITIHEGRSFSISILSQVLFNRCYDDPCFGTVLALGFRIDCLVNIWRDPDCEVDLSGHDYDSPLEVSNFIAVAFLFSTSWLVMPEMYLFHSERVIVIVTLSVGLAISYPLFTG